MKFGASNNASSSTPNLKLAENLFHPEGGSDGKDEDH